MAKFVAHDVLDDITLLVQAMDEAERWGRLVQAGAAHQGSHKVQASRKRKAGSGREVTLAERLAFAPNKFRADPPLRMVDKLTQESVYLGDEYSLPATWYGDLMGVGAHYNAVEALANAPRINDHYQGARSGQARKVTPTGPVGAMRWLTSTTISLAKGGRKSKIRAMIPLTPGEIDALFHDGITAHVAVQKGD